MSLKIKNPKIVVPEGYTQLKYIESSGTQYILLGEYDASTVKMVIDSSFADITVGRHGNVSGTRCYFGAVSSQWAVGYNSAYDHTLAAADTDRHTFTRSSTQFMVDDTVLKSYTSTTATAVPLYLFAATDSGGPQYKVSGKVYSCQVYGDGTTLSFNGVPAKNSSDEIGMYDTVSQTFFTNAGTGTFTAGDEVSLYAEMHEMYKKNSASHGLPSGYTELEYITDAGSSYIDTNIALNNTSKVSIDCAVSTSGTWNWIFGARDVDTGGRGNNIGINTSNYFLSDYETRTVSTLVAQSGKKYSIVKDGATTTITVDGTATTITNTAATFSITNKVIIGGIRIADASVSSMFSGNIYICKIYQDGSTLSFNGIPAKNSSNVVGMYDTVSQTFFTSATSTAFTAGPEVENYTYISEAYKKSVNLFDRSTDILNKYLNPTTGLEVGESNSECSTYISCKPSTTYTCSFKYMKAGFYVRLHTYNSSKEWNELVWQQSSSSGSIETTITYTFTTDTDDSYIRFSFPKLDEEVMLVEGSTAPSTYIPYGYEHIFSAGYNTTVSGNPSTMSASRAPLYITDITITGIEATTYYAYFPVSVISDASVGDMVVLKKNNIMYYLHIMKMDSNYIYIENPEV